MSKNKTPHYSGIILLPSGGVCGVELDAVDFVAAAKEVQNMANLDFGRVVSLMECKRPAGWKSGGQ